MPRRSPGARRRGARPGDLAFAVKKVELEDGSREELRVTGREIVHLVDHDGDQETHRISLDELGDVRRREKVRDLELMVAMTYLLGAVTFLNIMVNHTGALSTWSGLTLLYLVVASAAVAAAAAWLGRITVLRFESKDHRTHFDMSMPDDSDDVGRLVGHGRS